MADRPGPLLASGRAADVYDIGEGKVLRRYRRAGHVGTLPEERIAVAELRRATLSNAPT